MKIFFAQADTEGCAYYRTYLPGLALSRLPGVEVIATHEVEVARHIPWADVIVWQRQHRPELVPAREEARRLGKLQVYEIDDLMDEIPEWSPQSVHYPRNGAAVQRIHEWIAACDHLIVSTKPLGEAYAERTGQAFTVAPNALDFSVWKRRENDGTQVRVGWTGSTTHQRDLAEAQYAVLRLLEEHPEVELVMMGYDGGWKQRLAGGSASDRTLARRIDYYPWVAEVKDYPKAVAQLRLDLAFAPLVSRLEFNRCRSNVKFLEFAALSIPVVASRVEPYAEIEEGVTGFLAQDANEFHAKLERLVVDRELRATIGGNALAYVKERYDVAGAARALFGLFQRLLEHKRAGTRALSTAGR